MRRGVGGGRETARRAMVVLGLRILGLGTAAAGGGGGTGGQAQSKVVPTVPRSRLVRKKRPSSKKKMKKRHEMRLSLYAGIMTSGKLAVVTRMIS